jgi:ABC-type amino acid transport substrate-binding protein/ABC-type amino acid transport system permease subunit
MRLWLLLIVLLGTALPAWAQQDRSPDSELARVLDEARADCAQPAADRLVRILCGKRIRIGVRDYYPLFATYENGTRQGFEIDVADAIAARLGVEAAFTRVNAANRIALLAEDRIDLTIATMGHNTQRDSQVRFIRPHYYQSETILVGAKVAKVAGWADVREHTICATVGNGSNAELVSRGARLMLFDEAGVLPDRLKSDTCTLAAQDDSFFAAYFADPAFAAVYGPKFGFAQVPWGMAVARIGSDRLAHALDLVSEIFHRDGVFLEFARKHKIATAFLETQKAVWNRPDCNTAEGAANPACVLPALNSELQPTPFAQQVAAVETWVEANLGFELLLPMLKTAPAWTLFKTGVATSLLLIAGALAATLVFALLMGAAQGSRSLVLHTAARMLTIVLQSSPIVLTLVIVSALSHVLFPTTGAVAIGAAIVALGLTNGANAGQAIGEAVASLRHEGATGSLFGRALGRSASQIVSFLVNAAKGTPTASFIGAPELLTALTDITSFSSGRITTYWLLLIFYTVVVMAVVWLCGRLQRFLELRQVAP